MIMSSLGCLLFYFFSDILVKLVPSDLFLPEASYIVKHFLQLLIIQVEFQLL